MSEPARESYFEGNRLIGRLRFGGFAQTRLEGETLIDSGDDVVEIDLGGLAYANSLAVSAMIAWYRYGFRAGKTVRFSNVPTDLRKIIAVSGLVELLLGDE